MTEKGNPGNIKNLARACLELPLQFLRSGLEFVDTTGIGSAIAANTSTTLSFIPQSDAVVFMTSVDTPFTQAETDFLRAIREHVRKIFFVINKIDLVQEAEKQEILQFVAETLQRQLGSDEVKIFPTSSTLRLSSKLAEREEDYARSGVRALQEALSDFLTGEKNNALLVSILDKVLRLATEAKSWYSSAKVITWAGRFLIPPLKGDQGGCAMTFTPPCPPRGGNRSVPQDENFCRSVIGRIPLAAGKILGVPDVELPSQMVSQELPIHSLLMQQGYTNFQGTPKVPVFLACLPVFMVQSVLRKHMNIEKCWRPLRLPVRRFDFVLSLLHAVSQRS